MKNFLNYNYNLFPDKIYHVNTEKYFFVKNYKIYVKQYEEGNIENIADISNKLFYDGVKINTIICNKDGQYITKLKNKNIILIRVNSIENDCIEYTDILKLKNINMKSNLKEINLLKEWTDEIDILEKELLEYNNEYLMIKESFDYCIGCAENAVQLYKASAKDNETLVLGHFNCAILNMKNYLNPLNLCNIDFNYEEANYIKSKFIMNNIDYEELHNIIDKNENPEKLFACLLYPSYYFYLLKKLLSEQENDFVQKEIMNYVTKIQNYKGFLLFLKKCFKNSKEIQLLDWINK